MATSFGLCRISSGQNIWKIFKPTSVLQLATSKRPCHSTLHWGTLPEETHNFSHIKLQLKYHMLQT